MKKRKIPEPKEEFVKRISELLPDKKDNDSYWNILKEQPVDSIRCNTLKISPEELIKKLESKGWKIEQPWKTNPEVIIILGKKPEGKENEILINKERAKLEPGELGRSLEHLLGYYYIQELASMLPMIAMIPKENETYLDLCAAPGSKTTQAAANMKNQGTIIANELSMGRLRILASNLERCGVTNTLLTRKEGRAFCKRFQNMNTGMRFSSEARQKTASHEKEGKLERNRLGVFRFDKILLDAPCSGEGTLRSSPKTYLMWNPKTIKSLSHLQKQLFKESFKILKVGGEMIYSTCTHAPEENEEIVDFALKEFRDQIEIIDFILPIKTREGMTKWKEKTYNEKVKLAKRVYPQDNNTEGFFISKFRRVK